MVRYAGKHDNIIRIIIEHICRTCTSHCSTSFKAYARSRWPS
jgi:hypothetical protein